jgi:catechol 2,3-dioxygenase
MAKEPRVSGLRSVELGVPDVGAATKFYSGTWGLAPLSGGPKGAAFLRATGAAEPVLTLRETPAPALISVELTAADKATVDALHARARARGIGAVDAPAALRNEPVERYGFAFADAEGRRFVISCAAGKDGAEPDAIDRPRKLSHVVLNSVAAEKATEFFVDVLGFRLSDRTVMMDFVRCNADHHSVAFVRIGGTGLNHVAFEMPDFDSLMRGTGRLKHAGFPVEWGVGRHGPGNNIFNYFIDPHGFVIEYTSDVLQIVNEAAYPAGGPDDWKWPPGRVDRWGVSGPPSDRLKKAMDGEVTVPGR